MKYNQGKSTKRRRISAKTIVVSFVVVLAAMLIAGAIGARFWYQQQLQPLSSESSKTAIFVIKPGTTATEVSEQLESQKIIRSAQGFMWYLRNNSLRDSIQAGTYELSPSSSVQEIATTITEGKVQTALFTILPGKRIGQIRDSFIAAGFNEAEVDAALNPANYKNHPALVAKPSNASLEGYLYPDSFQRVATTTPEQIVRQSLDEMAQALTPEVIDGFQKQGLGIHQGVILSSIVVKESSNPQDAKKIAGVFFNRLKSGITLGSDVTYQYIADVTGQARNANIDSPYNTRKYAGLPPGPISNVTKSVLEAVAFPEKTDYLFFVAGDDGTVYFSKTQAEHEALTEKYCQKLCSVY
jgi:UPF0755 protein